MRKKIVKPVHAANRTDRTNEGQYQLYEPDGYSADARGTQGDRRVAYDAERGRRVEDARIAAGFPTQIAAAQAMSINQNTYQKIESGHRGLANHALTMSRAFNVRAEWLLYGRGPRSGSLRSVALSGRIGERGDVENFGEENKMPQDLGAFAEMPPIEGDYQAFIVRGEYPLLRDGDVIYTALEGAPEACIGKRCIATLADGRRKFGVLLRGAAAGSFMLMTITGAPLYDTEVVSAGAVAWIRCG